MTERAICPCWLIKVGVVLIFITSSLFLSCTENEQAPYSGPVKKITLAANRADIASLVYIAQEQRFFLKNGLNVEIKEYEAGKLAADAVITGGADISTSSEFVFVSNAFNNPELRFFSTISIFQNKEMIARRDKGISKPADLKGKKVGVTKKSGAEFLLGIFLLFNGLSMDDIEIVDLKPGKIVKSIISGEIDAAFIWDPNAYNIKKKLGENAVSWAGPAGHNNYFLLIAGEEWLNNNPEAAERFIAALIQAEKYVENSSEKAMEFIKNKFNYENNYIDYIFPKINFSVGLTQSLLVAIEDEARWRIENGLTDKTEVPNFLEYSYTNALEEVHPKSVTIIK